MRYSLTPLALAAAASATIIPISVGKSGLAFSPDSTTANIGDTLEFTFYNDLSPHGVAEGTFDSPCNPAPSAFFSGYMNGDSSGSVSFSVNVTSTDPIWYFCPVSRHCEAGMVGVVNPPSDHSVSDYANAAQNVGAANLPTGSGVGGVVATGGAGAASSTGSSSTGSSSTGSSTSGSTSSTTSTGSSSTPAVTNNSKTSTTATSSPTSSTASSSSSKGSAAQQTAGAKMGMAVVAGGLMALLV